MVQAGGGERESEEVEVVAANDGRCAGEKGRVTLVADGDWWPIGGFSGR